MKNYQSLIFTHIPKCGGSSFRRFICEVALDNGIPSSSIYAPGQLGVTNDKNLIQLNPDELKQLRSCNLRIVADHSCFGTVETYELGLRNPFYYTILRDPVARFISHYNFFCKLRGDHNMSGVHLNQVPEEVLDRLLLVFSNVQVRYLANIQKGRVTKEKLESAIENLMTAFPCFGILEQMDKSIELLKWKLPTWLSVNRNFPRANENRTSESGVDSGIIEKIEAANMLEADLYNRASSRFEKMTNQIGVG